MPPGRKEQTQREEEPSGRLGVEVLVEGLGVSAKSSGTVEFEIHGTSGGVPVCMHVRENLGNRRREHR